MDILHSKNKNYSLIPYSGLFLGFLWFLLGGIVLVPRQALALAISPSTVEVLNIPQNAAIAKNVFVGRRNPKNNERAKVTLEGPVAQYIELPKGEIMTLPQGEQSTAVPFIIKPGTLAAGTYEIKINIVTIPDPVSTGQSGTAGSRVVTGVQGTIRFSVTTDVIEDFEINTVNIQETEEGQVIGFSYQLVNRGNVDARPTKIEFTATDKNDPANSYAETILNNVLKPVKALTTERMDVVTHMQPKIGRYKTNFNFYNQEKMIFHYDQLAMQIFPRGTLAQKAELIEFRPDKTEYKSGESVKLSAALKNTGQIGISAALTTEIFQKDTRVELLKTEAPFVPMGETVLLENFFTPQKGGKYSAKAYASFGPYRSNELTAEFRVKQLNVILLVILLTVITAVLAGLLWWLHQRKKRRMNNLAQQPPKG